MKMKRILAAALSLLVVVSLCACGKQSGAQTSNGNDAVQPLENGRYPSVAVAIPADPESLEPINGIGIPRCGFYWNIYETLFDYTDDGELVPSIGKNITIVDEVTYDVEIYDCIHDSEGNPITAQDVVYSVNWLVSSGNANKYEIFDSVEAADIYTVRFHWKKAPASWSDLEHPLTRTFIFSQAAFESHTFASDPVGTGSYVVKSFTSGSSLVLEANDDYWLLQNPEIMDTHLDLHRANVQTIEYKVITEAAQAQIALEQGTVDYCDYVLAAVLPEFQSEKYADVYRAESTVSGDYYFLSGNCTNGPMTDPNMRMAVWYALDSASIAKVMGGQYVPMDTLGNESYADYDPAWAEETTYMNTYAVETAKEYLDKSFYNGEELILVGDSAEATKNALTMIQTQLAQIGVKSKIETQTQAMFNTTVASPTGWDIQFNGIGGTSLVGSYNRMLGNGINTLNDEGYTIFWAKDAKLQALFEAAKADESSANIKALIDYAVEQGYVYALVGSSTSLVYSTKFESLYYRENFYATVGCSTFAGCEAEHSKNVTVLSPEMPEPSETPDNVYIFNEKETGYVWTLTLGETEGYTIEVETANGVVTYTGHMYFPENDDGSLFLTTPPYEGVPAEGAFFEEDGMCHWEKLPDHGLVPTMYEDYEAYKTEYQANLKTFVFDQQDAGIVWTLTLGEESADGYTVTAEHADGTVNIYAAKDYFFADDVGNMIITTPPAEGKPAEGSFYEDDGMCIWAVDRTTGTMTPVNLLE